MPYSWRVYYLAPKSLMPTIFSLPTEPLPLTPFQILPVASDPCTCILIEKFGQQLTTELEKRINKSSVSPHYENWEILIFKGLLPYTWFREGTAYWVKVYSLHRKHRYSLSCNRWSVWKQRKFCHVAWHITCVAVLHAAQHKMQARMIQKL